MQTITPTKTAMIFAGEIFGGQDAEHPLIRDLDGNAHVVRVRAMPARHIGRVLQLCTKEAELLEFVCQVARTDADGKLVGWVPVDAEFVDNFDEASHVLLYEAAKRLNFTRAAAWGKRQIAAKEFETPMTEMANKVLAPTVEKLLRSLISLPSQSASPGEPMTKS